MLKANFITAQEAADPGWVYIMHDRNDTGQCK